MGKTALAVCWAQQVREEFPDRQLYVDLHGSSPRGRAPALAPAEAMGGLPRRPGHAGQRATGQRATGQPRRPGGYTSAPMVTVHNRGLNGTFLSGPGVSSWANSRLDVVARSGAILTHFAQATIARLNYFRYNLMRDNADLPVQRVLARTVAGSDVAGRR
jgi:hypothetical protein